ncbi:MAG TPA: hypothetical protein VHX65_18195 [Pirellulales bacterium]|jgi:hypothetical protein|nr:hypothetical protein [Pirellulales bacterium]
MEFNRNQFMMIGVVLLLLGLQFRTFESATLSPKTTQFLASRFQDAPSAAVASPFFATNSSVARKVVRPPSWLGWSLMSMGSVLILHSLAMKKPGG